MQGYGSVVCVRLGLNFLSIVQMNFMVQVVKIMKFFMIRENCQFLKCFLLFGYKHSHTKVNVQKSNNFVTSFVCALMEEQQKPQESIWT